MTLAILTYVNQPRGQCRAGLFSILEYTMKPAKVTWNGEKLVTGIRCLPQTAYGEFLTTKLAHGKCEGKMYYHFVQSFSPEEAIDPVTAHEMAVKLAQAWEGYEVIVATHVDREHCHSHFVVNSVSLETGEKYHSDLSTLRELRQRNDELCMQYGFSVCQPRQKKADSMSQAEYHSAAKGQSWKILLQIAIEDAMRYAVTREQFCDLMESEGYGVRWTDSRKNITFTCPNGRKCCDDKLHEEKFRKENLEVEFRIRKEIIRAGNAGSVPDESGESGNHADRGDPDRFQLGRADQSDAGAGRNVVRITNGYAESPVIGADERNADGSAGSSSGKAGGSGGRAVPDVRTDREPDDGGVFGDRKADARIDTEDSGRSEGSVEIDRITGWERERRMLLELLEAPRYAGVVAGEVSADQSDTRSRVSDLVYSAVDLLIDAAAMFEEDEYYEDDDGEAGEVDSRLKREIEAKKRGELGMSM